MIPYAFHPEAEAEFADAALFYESRVAGLGPPEAGMMSAMRIEAFG